MKKVCLFSSPFPFMQAIHQGVAACSARVGPWRVDMQYFAREESVVPFLLGRKYDGVIVTYRAPFMRAVEAAGIPVVNALVYGEGVPAVSIDDRAVGEVGARHLFECGYKRLAFFGSDEPWSAGRAAGFRAAVEREGGQMVGVSFSRESELVDAVQALRLSVGVMACNDAWARRLADHAIERGVRVPGDLAVLGVDNDELLCETGCCPLSSVDTDLHHVGFEAALLLDRRMRGEQIIGQVPWIKPKAVVRRQSTSLFTSPDPDIASAMRFLHERACDGVTVDEVCRHVALSRRRFEQRFTKVVGRSPGQEIRQVRIDRAKALLSETDMTLAEISVRCGYAYISGFAAAFRGVVGMSPGEYRRRNRKP